MATFRGQDGQVSIGGQTIAELQNFEVETNEAQLDTTAMGAPWAGTRGGLKAASGTMVMNLDQSTTAQGSLVSFLYSNAEAADLAFLGRVMNSPVRNIAGNIRITRLRKRVDRGSLVQMTADFVFNGAPTFS